ncbi:hypothetical protein Mapa_012509 [Marchantia paleacea]|nr:hypothetical protein Mapa_012509 [Marchantia paleacea]
MSTPEANIARFLHSRSIKKGHPEDTLIYKARADARSYRRVLLPNAMQVLLISDPDSDKAAASMDVHVGSFCDPDELPGLAHFLEHMLYFSNEKYPEEGSFKKFLVAHGGDSNAYTSCLNTNFQFEINADHLEEGLDRFAQFFICPLFAEDATYREIRAVDSENSRNHKSDIHRFYQLECHLTSRDHPFHKFSTGNIHTLEEIPKANGIDTRAEMLKFYQDHYSSNLMCLAIYGKETLDELQKLAREKFGAVKNLENKEVHFRGEPCSAEHLQILVKGVPVAEGHELKIMWPVTPSLIHYQEAPWRYVSHLFGHEGEGSLLALLKQLGWADSLCAGEDSCLHFSFYVVTVELTNAGQKHMDQVVALAFQYLSLLRKEGVASWIYKEIHDTASIIFHFQDKYSPFYYTSNVAENMRVYPPEDWLAGALPRQFDEKVLKEAIQQLAPERVRIFWYSKEFEDVATEVEPWYGTKFISQKIDDCVIKQWWSAEPDPRLHLPEPNAFIPTDFDIVTDAESKVQFPYVLKKTNMSTLWYKPDTKFRTPKARIVFQLNCPEANSTPEASALTRIFTEMLLDYLNAYAYSAAIAGLNYSISPTMDGLIVSVHGYNSKLMDLAQKIVHVIANFEVKEDRFIIMKEMVLKAHLNCQFDQPLHQANYSRNFLLFNKFWHVTDYLDAMPKLTAEHMRQMLPRILSRVFVECFISGNITSEDSENFLDHVEKSLTEGPIVRSQPPYSSQLMEQRVMRLEDGANFFHVVPGLNPEDENSALSLYLQIGLDKMDLDLLTVLLVQLMYDGVFHQLRTVEQLGYVVSVSSTNHYGVTGIEFTIQSTSKDPQSLEARVEAFLEKYAATLQEMSDEEFQKNVNTLIKNKLEKDKNIWEELEFFWLEIVEGTLLFDRYEVESEALRHLKKQSLIDFYSRYVQGDAPHRRKLSAQVYGNKHLEEYKAIKEPTPCTIIQATQSDDIKVVVATENGVHPTENGDAPKHKEGGHEEVNPRTEAQLIDDLSAFKRSQSLYSSLWGGLHPVYKK